MAVADVRAQNAATPSGSQQDLTLPTIVVDDEGKGYVAEDDVTATKTKTPVMETPQSVSVVTRRQMEQQGAQTVGEALRYTAGVLTNGGISGQRYDRNDNIFIRGFDATSVGLLRDGLRNTTTQAWNKVEPYGLERIEVLRGPAAVLYGQGAPGGMVNLITKKPLATPAREVEVRYGSFNQKQAQFDFTGPVDQEGKLLYRLVGLGRDSGTQFNYVPDDALFIAPSLTWRPSADTSLTVSLDYSRFDFGPPNQNIPIYGSLLPNTNGPIPANQYLRGPGIDNWRKTWTASYQFDHRINETWRFHSAARYADENLFSQFNSTGALAPNGRFVTRTPGEFNIHAKTFAADNHLVADWNAGRFDFVNLFGVDYRRTNEEFYFRRRATSPADFDVYNPVYTPFGPTPILAQQTTQNSDQLGFYAQQQVKLDKRWVLLANVRHDLSDTTTINRLNGTEIENKDSATTFRVGGAYVSDIGLTPYVSYSTTFLPVLGVSTSGQPYQATTGRQWDVGIKYQPVGSASQITVSVFDIVQNNVAVVDPNNSANRLQIGQISSRGIEGQAVLNLMPGLNLIASASFYQLRVTNAANPAEIGKRPIGLPERMAALWVDYTFQNGPLGGLGLGGGVRYVGDRKVDALNTLTVPGYTLLDAAVWYDFGVKTPSLRGLRLAVNATNLADKKYWDSCSTSACSAGYDRRVVASLRYRW